MSPSPTGSLELGEPRGRLSGRVRARRQASDLRPTLNQRLGGNALGPFRILLLPLLPDGHHHRGNPRDLLLEVSIGLVVRAGQIQAQGPA
jgi:hypothetical protein